MKKRKLIWLFCICILYLGSLKAAPCAFPVPEKTDTLYSAQIKRLLQTEPPPLYFPTLTGNFYKNINFNSVWMGSNDGTRLWEAIDLLNCVRQYGLDPSDYHSKDLTYTNLNLLALHSAEHKARMDLLITDAMLKFMAHLHFGKVNPEYSLKNLENLNSKGFRIDSALIAALNSGNLRNGITRVQPQSPEYVNLQDYLRLAVGQYPDDHEFSEKTYQLVALNLERLRWEDYFGQEYLAVNIPSFMLRYSTKKGEKIEFKVIVGKTSNPTPLLRSRIDQIITAPDWNVPRNIFAKELIPKALKNPAYLEENHFQIYDKNGHSISPTLSNLKMVQANSHQYKARQSPGCENALGRVKFNFPNPYSVYLHDTPDHSLFETERRAYSHGCIRVDDAEELARTLLSNDGATHKQLRELRQGIENYRRKQFSLKNPVPIVVRYMTCEMKDGLLITYPDLYNYDPLISKAIFSISSLPTE